jgi:hypothetical protein
MAGWRPNVLIGLSVASPLGRARGPTTRLNQNCRVLGGICGLNIGFFAIAVKVRLCRIINLRSFKNRKAVGDGGSERNASATSHIITRDA